MGYQPSTILSRLRGLAAVLMIAVLTAISLASTVALSSSAAFGRIETAEWDGGHNSTPKPCQRAVLPGAVNSCPLAGFNLNSLPADQSAAKTPDAAVHTLHWHVADARLNAQCGVSSPYRPPSRLV